MKTALPAFSFTDGSEIESVGVGSSSVIVPSALPSAMVAFTGAESVSMYVSCISSSRSPLTATLIVFSVSPGANVTGGGLLAVV